MTTLDEFRGSLKGAVPPSGIDHALQALWCWRRQQGEDLDIAAITDRFVSLNPKESAQPDSANHAFQRALGRTDQAHAVVDAARPEARLGKREALAFLIENVRGGHAHELAGNPGPLAGRWLQRGHKRPG